MRWIGLALLGILIAAAVAFAASRLASQQIGLASQPISAGDALAPKAQEAPKRQGSRHHKSQQKAAPPSAPSALPPTSEPPAYTTPTTTTPPVAPAEPEPSYPTGHDGESGGGADD